MYKLTETGFKMYNSNKELVDIPNDLSVTLISGYDSNNDIYVIQDEYIIRIEFNLFLSGEVLNSDFKGSLHQTVSDPIVVNNEVFGFEFLTRTLCYYYISQEGLNYQFNEVKIMDVVEVKTINNALIATVENANVTKKYKVYVENHIPKTELISEVTYDSEIIVVQPLN